MYEVYRAAAAWLKLVHSFFSYIFSPTPNNAAISASVVVDAVVPDEITYSTAISGCIKVPPELDAEHAADRAAGSPELDAAHAAGPELDAVHASYNTADISACKKGWPGPELDAMHVGVVPSENSYNAAISAC